MRAPRREWTAPLSVSPCQGVKDEKGKVGLVLGEGEGELPAPELGAQRAPGQGGGRRAKVRLDRGGSLPRGGRPSRGTGLPPPSASATLNSHSRAVFVCEVLSRVPGAPLVPARGRTNRGEPMRPNVGRRRHVFSWRWALNLRTDLAPAQVRILKMDSHQLGELALVQTETVAGGDGKRWLIPAGEARLPGAQLRRRPDSRPRTRGFSQCGLLGLPTPDSTLETLRTLEKGRAGGWFPWGFLPSRDCLILWSVRDVGKDVDLDALVEALKPWGPLRRSARCSSGRRTPPWRCCRSGRM